MKNNNTNLFELNFKSKILVLIFVTVTILFSIIPMNLSPIWNGKIPDHRNQYELMANSILEGKVYIDYGNIDEKLLNMKNPYDVKEREKLGVSYHWDHAFYKGKYYMYFGVAPVFLTFIPYQILTGHSLTTYHATQLYVALFIIGIFSLFYIICKYFYKTIKFNIYLISSAVFSILCIWISIGTPALYCTAITAGLGCAVWCLYFFIKAVYSKCSLNKSIVYAFIGSTFGAMTFACRPPIGIVNFLIIPMILKFLKNHKMDKKLFFKMCIAATPYLIIGILLMIYNYMRFDSIFEFGQTYQLTMADQHLYNDLFKNINIPKLLTNIRLNFFECGEYLNSFPFVNYSGVFLNFPILLIPYLIVFDEKYRKSLKTKELWGFYKILLILPLIVTIVDLLFSPGPGERYRMDIYYLMVISTFIAIINYYSVINNKAKNIFYKIILIFLFLTFIKIILLCLVPFDMNYTEYYPNVLQKINRVLHLKF